ncbi:MAG: hypothetical protein M3R29_02850 [Verrucomicrobiota bacterium]|nr:hypothetical protein [Verrucomicrobiota bacterium]
MINPNGDDFVEDNPLAAPMQPAEEQSSSQTEPRSLSRPRSISAGAGDTWERTKEKAGTAAQRTKVFLRENPIPTIVGALVCGLAIGWALRHATSRDAEEVEVKSPLGNLSFLSLPFLWPFFKSVRERYEESAEAVKDSVDRLKKIDVERYAKPVRKRWKAWTH